MLLTFFMKGTDVFSPARVFILIWSLAIGLADLKLSKFQLQWTAYSWIVLLLPLISFLIGVFVVYSLKSNENVLSVKDIRKIFANTEIDTNYLFKIILFLFVGYIISYIINALVMGYIPVFTFLPSESRVGWGIFGFGLIIHMSPPILVFSSMYLVSSKGMLAKKVIIMLVIMVTFVSFIFLLQRFDIIVGLFLIVIFLYYNTQKLRFRNVAIFLLLFVALIYGVSSFRTSKSIANLIYYVSDMKYSVKYSYFTEPYMYLAMNVENYANAVDKLEEFSYGYYTFDFLLAFTGLKHGIAEYVHFKDFPHLITANFNTYTMFFAYYRDFGLIGIGVIPFVLGLIISSVYYSVREKPNIMNISVYGMLLFAIIFSFFIPMLSWLHFVFNLCVIIVVSKMIIKKTYLKERR